VRWPVSALGRLRPVAAIGSQTLSSETWRQVATDQSETGKLRPGDSVLIGDEGVAVNELDYGETEKYLRANSSGSDTASNQ
jgi:hypothetical protein